MTKSKKLAKVIKLVNISDMVASMTRVPVVVNDLPMESDADRKALRNMLVTVYNTQDVFSDMPRCECGFLDKGHYISEDGNGRVCPICNFEVQTVSDRRIESNLVIKATEGVDKLLSPIGWIIMSTQTKQGAYNLLPYMLNPYYRENPRSNRAKELKECFDSLGVERGIRSVYDNWEIIIDAIANITKQRDIEDWRVFNKKFKDTIWSEYLMIPTKVAFAIEETSICTFYDNTMNACIDAVFTASLVDKEANYKSLSPRLRNSINAKLTNVMAGFGTYFEQLWAKTLQPKEAWIRQAIYGCRVNNSYRCVVTSDHGPHDYRECGLPYSLLLNIFQIEIYGKLTRRGYTVLAAYHLIESHLANPHPLLWELLEELINETPPKEKSFATEGYEDIIHPFRYLKQEKVGGGLSMNNIRYPSLDRLSTQFHYCTFITDETLIMSLLDVIGMNCDFDGDNIQGFATHNQPGFELLRPHYGLHSEANPFNIRNIASLPDTVVVMKYQARIAEKWEI